MRSDTDILALILIPQNNPNYFVSYLMLISINLSDQHLDVPSSRCSLPIKEIENEKKKVCMMGFLFWSLA